MFHVKHDNPLNNPTTPTTTQNPYGETHPKKPAHQANTLTENELLKSSHALWLIEKSNRIPPTVKRTSDYSPVHVKHQLLGNDEEENSSQIPSPHNSTTPSYVSRETIGLLKLIQRPQTWLVSISKEDQAK